ncbi:hypothetical protein [Phenylobacterium sp.]|uniref:hypothetical protein n=1 Tax=Phenylobacterium sp. TaxID=1871053 RepID=UPI0027325783|nr:hypothetical protein [Phenylobacterium sp.]MDP3854393.1 hypothetical protein [Phenylobacterium sp.]
MTGLCRAALAWTDRTSSLDIAFGTHSNLQVWVGGGLHDITPGLARASARLGANPLSVSNASTVITVAHVAHGLATGDSVMISGSSLVGGVTPSGLYSLTVTGPHAYAITHGSAATSTAVGGGSAVVSAPQNTFSMGSVDGAGGAGYGTGSYSTGDYSEPSTADYFPRTWALAAWGENLLANPRGGAIHAWTNDTMVMAAPLANSPRQVTHMLVAPQDQVFALGCNEEVSGAFNPLCIRHSSVRNSTVWNTAANTTAREYILPGGGRIVAGRVVGPYLLVWTTHALFLGTFVGALGQPWRFDRVGEKCGLIGPNGAVVVGQGAYWLGPDLQFYRYLLGGAPEPLACPIHQDFADNLAPSQGDKVVASSISAFSEIRFDYPDARDGSENSRYLSLSLADGAWSRGVMARTAMVDAGPAQHPIGVDPVGQVYWHERGASADGGPFSWFVETADQHLDEDVTAMVRGLWPDIKDQQGPVAVTVISRFQPQGEERVYGPYLMAPGEDRIDIRATGRLFRMRLSGGSSPTACRIGKPVFDIAVAGRR